MRSIKAGCEVVLCTVLEVGKGSRRRPCRLTLAGSAQLQVASRFVNLALFYTCG
jgi:hypothetical protein